MNTHRLFSEFDSIIRLSNSKVDKLKSNRKALRDKIRAHFDANDWNAPSFYSQGSFPLRTNLNPIKVETSEGDIKEKYDLDDGIYISCPKSDRKEPAAYHDRIKNAVDGHAQEVVDKNTCVRVVYADGHHIDLPCYWIERNGDIPQLAHKSEGFIVSDPKAFGDWVKDQMSSSNSNGQLRRVIRYLKAWKNYREHTNSNIKLPSGFILTILACNHFSNDGRDDSSFKRTIESIEQELRISFTCYRPTVPIDEDLLTKYSKDTVLREFRSMVENAQEAFASDCEKKASEFWRKVFGNRFPMGKGTDHTPSNSNNSQPTRVEVNRPWTSS